MKGNFKKLPLGKLKHQFLHSMIKNHISDLKIRDKRVIVGSKIGEDAAVIDMGDKYLVAKTDPITFATDEIGYYVVNVNVNDLVCTGAIPRWFQSTILLPESATKQLIERIFRKIHDTCMTMGITIVGGHTEITMGLERPIVVGSLLGEVEKEKFVSPDGAEPGDAIVLTKGVFIEGTSIIAREKEKELSNKGLDPDFIKKCKNYLYNPGISVLKEARLANQNFKIKRMHDPTEGGVYTAIAEMAIASNLGVIIEESKINVLPEPKILSKIFGINPLNTLSSGSLLIAVNQEDSYALIELLIKNNINAEKIGQFVPKEKGMTKKCKNGEIKPLTYSETDEISKIF
jgi:hydrogenase maturation factor